MSTPVLEIVDLRKSFDQNLVLHDVNLVVPEHTATVLIGASGSGKSTLLRCINLLEPIDDGLILLDGQEISDPAIDVDLIRRKLGIVFQSFNLFPHMKYPDRLSGGQQQRAAIIRSIAVNPRLLLLDEVTSALDPVLVNEVLSIVRDLKSDGMTMVLATHEMGFATQVADQVCFLESGLILERGTPEEVLRSPSHPKTKEFLKRVHEAGRL